MHHAIREFLVEWNNWRLGGAPEVNEFEFNDSCGLCSNLDNYLDSVKEQFGQLLNHEDYPFETKKDYQMDKKKHLNPKRIAWVERMINDE